MQGGQLTTVVSGRLLKEYMSAVLHARGGDHMWILFTMAVRLSAELRARGLTPADSWTGCDRSFVFSLKWFNIQIQNRTEQFRTSLTTVRYTMQ